MKNSQYLIAGLEGTIMLITILLLVGSACQSERATSNDEREMACMERVMHLDDSLGIVRNFASEQTSLSQAIDEYTASLRNVSFKGCPDSFTLAFNQHVRAWDDMTVVTDRYPGLRGEMHILFDSLGSSPDSTAFKIYLDEIWDTWSNIEDFTK